MSGNSAGFSYLAYDNICLMGRPSKEQAQRHPLAGQFDGDVPWLDGCAEYNRSTCLDCPVDLIECPAQNPRLHKGGRRRPKGNKT
jgi:hypothetical protein